VALCLFALAQGFNLPQMLIGQIAQNRCYLLGGLSVGTKIENEMIYCLKPEMYPTPEQTIEEISLEI